MKILVVCQHYWPEPYPLADVCEELVKRGHQVDVVTGVPNYPMGVIYPEYVKGRNRRQERNGVRIFRTFTIGRRHNILFRFLNYYSFAISSRLFVRKLPDDYDVVFTNQTSPVMMSEAAMDYAKRHGKKVILYCMDLWPASLAAGGIGQNSLIYKYYTYVSKRIYNQADRILITSKMFEDYFVKELGIAKEKLQYHPQYADSRFEALPQPEKKDHIDLMFAGNVGAAQSLDTVLKAADILREEPIMWHIVGDGSELEHLKAFAKEHSLDKVIFHGRKPAEDMPRYYAMADAMLLPLTADPFISMTLPGKAQTYMAAGKPIIASANGETARVIREAKCGFVAPAQDAQGLAEAVSAFAQSADKEMFGTAARAYYVRSFTRQAFIERLEKYLAAMKK